MYCATKTVTLNFPLAGTDEEEEAQEGEPPLRKLKSDEGGFVKEEDPKKASDDEEDGQVSASIKCGSKIAFVLTLLIMFSLRFVQYVLMPGAILDLTELFL